ncbi:MAG: S8 family serine peptidase [Nitrospira sp.]|nr:S8 family serine peptidase [Nitrospira sp.]
MNKKGKVNQLGKDARKCDAKLRVIANGDTEVNVVRAERCDALSVAKTYDIKQCQPSMEKIEASVLSHLQLTETSGRPTERERPPTTGKLETVTSDISANVFISKYTNDPLPRSLNVVETATSGSLSTATIPLSKLKQLTAHSNVRHISLGQGLRDPNPLMSTGKVSTPDPALREVKHADLHKHGKGVLVGIIDVQGFDFAHPDFLVKGKTRFEAIWDMGAEADGTSLKGYGRIISQKQMNKALAANIGAPATQLEPQSQMDFGSHGTHVASIAAGNAGIAREATIAGVLVSLGPEDEDRRKTFYDSTRLAHAVDWLMDLGKKLKMPVSINISLGTNGHAHDSSAPINRWIDAWLATPGRSVCVAAGNAGQEKAESPDDVGFVMGRIHTSGKIQATGLNLDIDWTVAGSDGLDYSENELEIWFSAQDKIGVSVRDPAGNTFGPVEPLEFIENQRLPDGTFISIYNDLYHEANGANYIGIFLSPNFNAHKMIGIAAGEWIVRLHGRDIRDGRFDGWIERDDPLPLTPNPEQLKRWRFPSFFSERSNVDCSSISTLACGHRVVAVANLDQVRECINVTSSQGPTREGANKPDIAAPGTDIVAANGFSSAMDAWVGMTGTSMASPFVCGTVALMLATRPDLTAAQILGIIQRSATPLVGKSFAWENDAGFGRIDPAGCVLEAQRVNLPRKDKTR